MREVWKDIGGFEGLYKISNTGKVLSLPRLVFYKDGRIRKYESKILKDRYDGKGYVRLSLHKDKICSQIGVHQLVGKAFISNPENKPCINHKDSNRTNNNVDNLEWVTHSENTIHAINKGRIYNPAKKINIEQVLEIRDLWNEGLLTQREIGLRYKIGQVQVCRIVNYINWNK